MGTVVACVICLMLGGCMGFIVSGLIFANTLKEVQDELDRERRAKRQRTYLDYSNYESIKENGLDEYRL